MSLLPTNPVDLKACPVSPLDAQLIESAEEGDINGIKAAIESKANVNVRGEWRGATPMMRAARNGHQSGVELLIRRKASVHAKDEFGWSSMFWACHRGHLGVAQALFSQKCSVNIRDFSGETPLMNVCGSDGAQCFQLVSFLVTTAKADLNVRGGLKNLTPLDCAKKEGNIEVIDFLMNHCTPANKSKRTPVGPPALSKDPKDPNDPKEISQSSSRQHAPGTLNNHIVHPKSNSFMDPSTSVPNANTETKITHTTTAASTINTNTTNTTNDTNATASTNTSNIINNILNTNTTNDTDTTDNSNINNTHNTTVDNNVNTNNINNTTTTIDTRKNTTAIHTNNTRTEFDANNTSTAIDTTTTDSSNINNITETNDTTPVGAHKRQPPSSPSSPRSRPQLHQLAESEPPSPRANHPHRPTRKVEPRNRGTQPTSSTDKNADVKLKETEPAPIQRNPNTNPNLTSSFKLVKIASSASSANSAKSVNSTKAILDTEFKERKSLPSTPKPQIERKKRICDDLEGPQALEADGDTEWNPRLFKKAMHTLRSNLHTQDIHKAYKILSILDLKKRWMEPGVGLTAAKIIFNHAAKYLKESQRLKQMVSKLEAISAAPVPRPDSLTNKHTNYDDSKMTALSGGYGKSKAASQPDDHRLKRRGSGVGLRKINTLKSKNGKHLSTNEKLLSKNEKLLSKNEKLLSKNEKLLSKNEKLLSTNATLLSKNEKLLGEVNRLKMNILKLDDQNTQLLNEITKMKETYKCQNKEHNSNKQLKSSNEDLLKANLMLRKDRNAARKEVESQEEVVLSLRSQLTEAKDQNINLKAKMSEFESKVSSDTEIRQHLQHKLEQEAYTCQCLQQSLESLGNQVKQKDTCLRALAASHEILKQQHQQKLKESTMDQKLKRLTMENEALRNQNTALTDVNNALTNTIKQREAKLCSISSENVRVVNLSKDVAKQLHHAKKLLEDKITAGLESEERVLVASKGLDNARSQITTLQQQLDGLKKRKQSDSSEKKVLREEEQEYKKQASRVVDQESLSRLSTGALSYWLRHVAAAKFKISDATIEKIVHESIDGECLLLIQTQEEHFKSLFPEYGVRSRLTNAIMSLSKSPVTWVASGNFKMKLPINRYTKLIDPDGVDL
ncbi:hypothetical protein AAMO2058_001571000 [Amorphochlora amoebiformis]